MLRLCVTLNVRGITFYSSIYEVSRTKKSYSKTRKNSPYTLLKLEMKGLQIEYWEDDLSTFVILKFLKVFCSLIFDIT